MQDYQSLLNEIKAQIASFVEEAEKGDKVKLAAGRARKVSNSLGKLLKEYRAASIEHHKKA